MSKGVEVAHSWGVRKEEATVAPSVLIASWLHEGASTLGFLWVPFLPLVPIGFPTSRIPGISILRPSRVASHCCGDVSFLREQGQQRLLSGSCD